jgi:hypothetical protein
MDILISGNVKRETSGFISFSNVHLFRKLYNLSDYTITPVNDDLNSNCEDLNIKSDLNTKRVYIMTSLNELYKNWTAKCKKCNTELREISKTIGDPVSVICDCRKY